eukprot:2663543-Lingulodinium_polyedra.AAC.1
MECNESTRARITSRSTFTASTATVRSPMSWGSSCASVSSDSEGAGARGRGRVRSGLQSHVACSSACGRASARCSVAAGDRSAL